MDLNYQIPVMKLVSGTPTISVKETSQCLRRMKIAIEGLQIGTSSSVANSLRRTMLSNIPGMAPIAIKFVYSSGEDGQPIKGLTDDTSYLSLIIKKLRVIAKSKTTGELPSHLLIEINKEYHAESIKFGDFKLASKMGNVDQLQDIEGFEVLNPDEILTYVGSETKQPVHIQVLLETGVGYSAYNNVGKDEIIKDILDTGFLVTDSLYSPVKTVAINIIDNSPTIDTETLELVVETDGSISPLECVRKACVIMIEHYKMIYSLCDVEPNDINVMLNANKAFATYNKPNEISDNTEIEAFGLSTEYYNLLKNAHCNTLKDLKANKDLLSKEKEIIKILENSGITIDL